MGRGKLERGFYLRDALTAAPDLLGKLLVHESREGRTSGLIVEVEAYVGPGDKGAHSYGGRPTERTRVQYGPGGYAYVYLIYGMYACFNIVLCTPGRPESALVRALEPREGEALMAKRRKGAPRSQLCSGPGKLCQAMGITLADRGADLCGERLYLEEGDPVSPEEILLSPRVNIDYAQEYRDCLWRYYLRGNPFVSKVPGRFAGTQTLAEQRNK